MNLSRLLLVPGPPRQRPPDLSYAADERPPLVALLSLATQHAVMALSLSAYVLIACRSAGVGAEATRLILSGTVLAMAVATLLQAVGRGVGSGGLLVHIPNPFYIGIVGGAMKVAGPSALVMIGLTSGVVQLFVARAIPYLRPVFPSQVAGVVVLVAGLSLVEYAFEGGLGLDHATAVQLPEFIVFLVTFGAIAALSVWGSRALKLYALFVGLALGVATAAGFGILEGGDRIAAAPLFGLPALSLPAFDVGVGTLAALAVMAIMVGLDTLACVVIIDKMDNAAWSRPDMRRIAGGITANGIGDIASGVFGGMQVAPSSANIGLAHASRATSRVIGLVVAAMMLALALMPKLTVTLTLMPGPVMGAVALYAASFLITSGIELVASRALDSRGVFLVGVSVSLGLIGIAYEDMVSTAPDLVRALFEDAVIVAGISAVGLNLLFRLNSRQTATYVPTGEGGSAAVTAMLEKQGAAWGVRRDVLNHAKLAAGEAVEMLERGGSPRRLTAVTARFDETDLTVELVHTGDPAVIKAPTPVAPGADLDEAAFQEAASAAILSRLTDRITSGPRDGGSYLLLHFEH
jgi:xanthine/uracil permease